VKVYSIEDGIKSTHFVDYINPNYYRAKGNDDDNYKVLLTIIKITIPFPIALAVLFFVSGHHVFKQYKDFKDKLLTIKYTYLVALFATSVHSKNK